MNAAGGTVYLADKKELYIKHTTRCRTLLRTIIDPEEIIEQDVQSIYVQERGIMAFKTTAINPRENKIKAKINNLFLINGNLTDPIPIEGKLGTLTLEIVDQLKLEEATILEPAQTCKITTSNLKINATSQIIYGDSALWLNVTGSFDIFGNIYPAELDYADVKVTPTLYILAGVSPEEPDPLLESHRFIIQNTSVMIGNYIQIFSDEDLVIKGNLNNFYRDRDNEWKIVQSCRLMDPRVYVQKDVFRCVHKNHFTDDLTHDWLINRYNNQFNGTSRVKVFSDMFEKMTSDYSIYIQSLKSIQLEGNVTGNRIGF